jgi:hypothetical protein
MRRFIGNTEVTVLTPSVALRNRYDTYGIDVNNASILLRVATSAGRTKFVPNEEEARSQAGRRSPAWRLLHRAVRK